MIIKFTKICVLIRIGISTPITALLLIREATIVLRQLMQTFTWIGQMSYKS